MAETQELACNGKVVYAGKYCCRVAGKDHAGNSLSIHFPTPRGEREIITDEAAGFHLGAMLHKPGPHVFRLGILFSVVSWSLGRALRIATGQGACPGLIPGLKGALHARCGQDSLVFLPNAELFPCKVSVYMMELLYALFSIWLIILGVCTTVQIPEGEVIALFSAFI